MRLSSKAARELGIIPEPPRSPQGREKRQADRKAKEALVVAYVQARGLPVPIFEYRFDPVRKWRFDLLFDAWLAVEVQGGLFTQGRHARGAALRDEYDKLNEAVVAGYSVLFCTPQDVDSGAIFAVVERALLAGDRS
jgi:hypothetical protein